MARILLAEDKEDLGLLIEEIIRREGHETVLTANGKEAIEVLQKDTNFDLLITDIIMPVMDGFDLAKFVSEMDKKIPIIAMSGGGITMSSDNALKAIEQHVDLILRKPIDIDELNKAITSLM